LLFIYDLHGTNRSVNAKIPKLSGGLFYSYSTTALIAVTQQQ